MKKIYYLLVAALFSLVSCQETIFDEDITQEADFIVTPIPNIPVIQYDGDPIILGRRLDNPYSLENMRIAFRNIQPEMSDAGIEEEDIVTTHYYVRFRPDNEEELQDIKALYSDFELYEYPLDYEMSGRVSYHDPEIPDSLPTYQYASIDSVSWRTIPLPQNIDCEVIERLFIPDDDLNVEQGMQMCATRSSSYNDALEALVNESMRLTGNLEEEEIPENGMMSSNSTWYPAGRITAYDDIVDGQIPLEGVKVRARRWFTTHTAVTDANGEFVMSDGFKKKANYSIVWEGDMWDIRDGDIGQAYYNGPKKTGDWNLEIPFDNYKSIRYAAIHRAAHRMFEGDTYGLSRPQCIQKIAYHHDNNHNYCGIYFCEAGMGAFCDIRILGYSSVTNSPFGVHQIISTTFHELGHAAHFTNNPIQFALSVNLQESWASFVEFYLVLMEYQDLGFVNGPFDAINYEPYPYTMSMYYVPDNIINRQLKQITNNEDYLPIFIDMYDSDNQYITNVLYNPYLAANRDKYPYDVIRIIPADIIEDFVFNSRTILSTKTKLINFYNSIDDYEKSRYNLTPETINSLFLLYK